MLDDLPTTWWGYCHLVLAGYVNNRTTLKRYIDNYGFPKPIKFGPHTAKYSASAVKAWADARERPAR